MIAKCNIALNGTLLRRLHLSTPSAVITYPLDFSFREVADMPPKSLTNRLVLKLMSDNAAFLFYFLQRCHTSLYL